MMVKTLNLEEGCCLLKWTVSHVLYILKYFLKVFKKVWIVINYQQFFQSSTKQEEVDSRLINVWKMLKRLLFLINSNHLTITRYFKLITIFCIARPKQLIKFNKIYLAPTNTYFFKSKPTKKTKMKTWNKFI